MLTSVRAANVMLGSMFVAGLTGILVQQFGTSTLADPALVAKRDPGQGLIWLAGVLLVAGVTVSLLRPRRRIWARYDARTVRLAVVGGDPFREETCERLVRALPAAGPSTGGTS